MNLKEQLDALLDATAFDSTGTKVGAVRQVYVDDASGKLTFATVSTGIFSADAIVPLHGARLLDNELHVDHTRVVIRDSPRPEKTEDGLTPEQEIKLLEYYGIEPPTRGRGTAEEPAKPKGAPKVGSKDGSSAAGGAAAGTAAKASASKPGVSKPGEAKPTSARPDDAKPGSAQPGGSKDANSRDSAPETAAPSNAPSNSPKPAAKGTSGKSDPDKGATDKPAADKGGPSAGPSGQDAEAAAPTSDRREAAPEKKGTTTTSSPTPVDASGSSDRTTANRPGSADINAPATSKDGDSDTSPKRD